MELADLAISRSQLSVLLSSSFVGDVFCIFRRYSVVDSRNPDVSLTAPVSDALILRRYKPAFSSFECRHWHYHFISKLNQLNKAEKDQDLINN
jgi:hypothetical protein